MIISFSATNFLSLRDTAEINLCATALQEQRETLIPSAYTKYGLLPVVALFGANASGKSNMLYALAFMRSAVLNSFGKVETRSKPPYRPFALDDRSKQDCSRFEIDLVIDEVRYRYGFAIDKEGIQEEWLYSFPKKSKVVLFERNAKSSPEFRFGRALTGANRQIESITRRSSLYLSAAQASGHPILSRIAEYFDNDILIQRTPGALPDDQIAKLLVGDEVLLKEAEKYLDAADTGIISIKLEKSPMPEDVRTDISKFYKAVSEFLGDLELDEVPNERHSIKLGHRASDGEVKFIDFAYESLGTRYLLTLLPSMLAALRNGSTLVLDEITTSLHTLLAKRLVAAFKSPELNKKGAQLIFSSHDTNLLSPGVLRRDEIWFAEKSEFGATTVFPLTDIRTKNTDNIERGYIQGRFGAVPFIPELDLVSR